MITSLDFETYSEAGLVYREGDRKWVSLAGPGATKKSLPLVGMYKYAAHPSTEVLCAAYDLGDGNGACLWLPCMPPPEALLGAIRHGAIVEAWNAGFEWLIWNHVCTRLGWPPIAIEQMSCSAAKARAYGLPGQLGRASSAVGAQVKDSATGRRVLGRFSVPRNPTKNDSSLRIHPNVDAEGAYLYAYCEQDVRAERSVSSICPPLSAFERNVWLIDQRINQRGMPIDMAGVDACLEVLDGLTLALTRELQVITGGAVGSASEIQKIQAWLSGRGFHMAAMDAEAVDAALAIAPPNLPLPYPERRVLEIRTALSSAGVKKLKAFKNQAGDDNRLRGSYIYGAAHTLRWSSEGVQTHNMKSSGPTLKRCDVCRAFYHSSVAREVCPNPVCGSPEWASSEVEWDHHVAQYALGIFSRRDAALAQAVFGPVAVEVMASCVRALICTGEETEILCSDYSAIEAVVLAMLSGEQWRINVFRTHGLIYETCVADMTGVSLEEQAAYKEQNGQHHPFRKKFGKIPELASGYGGWINAWKKFGAEALMSDDEIKASVLKWRDKSPMIPELWGGQFRKHPDRWEFRPELYGLEGAWIAAMMSPGQRMQYRFIGYTFDPAANLMRCHLPSGRDMIYQRPRLESVKAKFHDGVQYRITYWTDNTNAAKGGMGWTEVETYGGSLTENVCQAVSREIFANGMANVEAAGYPVILHTHDEIGAEVFRESGSIEEFERLMVTLPAWCSDWPIKAAGGWRGRRYRK